MCQRRSSLIAATSAVPPAAPSGNGNRTHTETGGLKESNPPTTSHLSPRQPPLPTPDSRILTPRCPPLTLHGLPHKCCPSACLPESVFPSHSLTAINQHVIHTGATCHVLLSCHVSYPYARCASRGRVQMVCRPHRATLRAPFAFPRLEIAPRAPPRAPFALARLEIAPRAPPRAPFALPRLEIAPRAPPRACPK